MVVLPEQVMHFDISKGESIVAISQAMKAEKLLFLVTRLPMKSQDSKAEGLHEYGCVCEVKQVLKLPKNVVRILVVGRNRGKLLEQIHEEREEGSFTNGVLEVVDIEEEFTKPEEMSEEEFQELEKARALEEKAKVRELRESFEKYAGYVPATKKETVSFVKDIHKLRKLVDVVASVMKLDYSDQQKILETVNLEERYVLLLDLIRDEIQIAEIKGELHVKVKEGIDISQKEYYLREEMKVIRKELGEDTIEVEVEEYKKAVDSLQASDEVKDKLHKEIKRFASIHSSSAEHGLIRAYIETMLEMPWDLETEDNGDIHMAKEVLDAEHYGLDEVKERILEFLAVRSLNQKGETPIICLVGPPGTGKTSIAASLAEALDKAYVRISLGGIHDEAEIRGHRKTYIGAMPGRIANGLKQAGSKNPLLLLDEIDKVSRDHKGDTHSALLEVLDSAQNMNFRDHYLEVPLDLSQVLFVATANSVQTIPRPLLDRMEVIEVSSYTANEKMHIAERHLIPKQLEIHGLLESQLTISKAAIDKVARNYTKEAGVRQLERKIGAICRKVAKEIVENKKKKVRITETNLEKYLGKEKFRYKKRNATDEIGVVRGLAWTSVGGDTLQIEAIAMPGKGAVTLTGQLGNVMKESATAAISYIRTIAAQYEIPETYFLKHDIHVHIPEGAVPKDGPSAGITMALAILSAVSGKAVRADLAMTGEVTLRGKVLPIGGLKEKLLAAKNAGITTVIIPAENQRDISEITTEITKDLEIIPVAYMAEVCEIAFAN